MDSKYFKELSISLNGDFKYLTGEFYILKSDLELLSNLNVDNLNNKKYFEKIFSYTNNKTEEFLNLETKRNLRYFITELVNFAGLTALIELSALVLDVHLMKRLDTSKSGNNLMEQIKPLRNTLLMQYLEEINQVNEYNLHNFLKKYRWVGTHGFEGEGLTEEKVKVIVKNRANQKSETKINAIQYNDVMLWVASELIFYRSNIMETINRVAFSYKNEMIILGKKYNLTYEDILKCTWQELLQLIDNGIIPDNLKQRTKEFGIIKIGSQYTYITSKDLENELLMHQPKIENLIKELRGIPAYRGIVRGIAKILTDNNDIQKIQRGDIIVASETTIDYVIVMEKAAAFVTNQGGLTSHAAVIAREMKKPCIVGTGNATKVFKDGDLIEVDANKGIVRKINH